MDFIIFILVQHDNGYKIHIYVNPGPVEFINMGHIVVKVYTSAHRGLH